ncbi:HAUS augmin-like complex subunit 6 [Protopterus annectens]|uniref:HAUS augmin-like complex subunit 6 n=1 Tax=Protopterus annectens TaxID=7888 RepID=UPI001CFA7316|nr:HAUS augmin-like complex subunit 6 [Protopterus annectens]
MSFSVPSWEKDHLWMYLCGMKFDALAAAAAAHKSQHTRINLGVNMFEKPNKDAFYIVSHFLFEKLDRARCKDAFRFCWPPLDKKQDAEYRKVCLDWMREISDESGSGFPQVAASLFLSPGGPKFIHLMYHFARYVLTQEIKKDAIGINLVRPKSSEMVIARHNMVYGRFLKACQKQDLILGDFQRRVLALTTEIRTLKSECASMESELQKMNRIAIWDHSRRENVVKKVRSIWMVVMDTLSSLRQEKEILDSILKGDVDLYLLDGTEVLVKIPRRLLARVEEDMNAVNENIYEAGKLNFLTLLKVLNIALQYLCEERQKADPQGLEFDIKSIEDKIKLHEETLAGLKCCRQKVKEVHMLIRDSVSQKMMEWSEKWERFLGQDPYSLMENNPTLELLPSVGPLSFESASEDDFRSCLITRYPPSVPDYFKTENYVQGVDEVETTVGVTVPDASKQLSSWRFSSLPMDLYTPSKVNDFTFLEDVDAQVEPYVFSIRCGLLPRENLPLKLQEKQLEEEKVGLSYSAENLLKIGSAFSLYCVCELLTVRPASSNILQELVKFVMLSQADFLNTANLNTEATLMFVMYKEIWTCIASLVASQQEEDTLIETPVPSKNLAQEGHSASVHRKYDQSEMRKKMKTCMKEQKETKMREDPLSMAYTQLAKQMADEVVSVLPVTPGGKGMEFNEMFTALVSDPFSARKQIPRTPENLISDIRNSWRKAVATESPSTFVTTVEEMVKESQSEISHACPDPLESTGACLLSTSNVSDVLRSSITDQHASVCLSNAGEVDAVELCTDKEDEFHHESGTLAESKRLDVEQQENSNLKTDLISLCDDVQYKNLRLEASPITPAEITAVENSVFEETKVEDRHQFTFGASYDDSLHTTWSWNSLQMFHSIDSSDSHEVILSIHQETLPEENDTLSLNSSRCMESDKEGSVEVVQEQAASGYSEELREDSDVLLERKIDLQDIRSRLEQLKKNACHNVKTDKSLTKYKSDSALYDSPAGRVFSLDLEYLKTPSRSSMDKTCSADEDFLESLKHYGQEERWMSGEGEDSAFGQQSLLDETADG